MKIRIFTDGAARGNPGPAGIGVVVYSGDGAIIEQCCRYLGTATNNVAEYHGLITGLTLAQKHQPSSVEMFLDSELVVRQMKGQYKVKNANLSVLYQQACALASQLQQVRFVHVPREQNSVADGLANVAIDTQAHPQ
ncbi:MAG: ribonuclease HI family protein [Endomicrobiales bacterium]|jgi:ribonuclease HI